MSGKFPIALLFSVCVATPAAADIWRCEFGTADSEADTGLIGMCARTLSDVIETETRTGCENDFPDERISIANLVIDSDAMRASWEEHHQRPPHLRPARVEWLMERGTTAEEAEELAARIRVFPHEGVVMAHSVTSGYSYGDPITDAFADDIVFAQHTFAIHAPEENRTLVLITDKFGDQAFLTEPIREGVSAWLEIRLGHCVMTPTLPVEPAGQPGAQD